MRILGAVLAGGRSRRFGSDKATAILDGASLIDRVVAALALQTDGLVVCGRASTGIASIPDRPHADLGPLGGLAAALHHALDHGYDLVASVPCDTPVLPVDLITRLAPAPGFVAAMPVIGVWPAALSATLDDHLAGAADRSMRRWIARIGATPVAIDGIANVNTVDDLDRLARRIG